MAKNMAIGVTQKNDFTFSSKIYAFYLFEATESFIKQLERRMGTVFMDKH